MKKNHAWYTSYRLDLMADRCFGEAQQQKEKCVIAHIAEFNERSRLVLDENPHESPS
jgi:hypothetical protein